MHILEKLDIPFSDNELIIRRQITATNNNIIKVNNQVITLKDLKEITSKLADIHTQLDTHRLINPLTYLEIIDGFHLEETEVLITDYQLALKDYKVELKELNRLKNSNDDILERLDLMRFQVKELESFNLDLEEEAILEDEIEKMQNFDKIYQNLNEVKLILNTSNAIDLIYDASKHLGEIEEISDKYLELKNRFNSSYFELEDAFEMLKDELSGLDFNPRLLDAHQERLNSLDSLKRKYRKDIPSLIDYLAQIKKDIENVDNFDEIIIDQEIKVTNHFKVVLDKAHKITKLRRNTSNYIEKELLTILGDLELANTNFKVEFINELSNDYHHSTQFLVNGVDEVDFLLTTNVGEPLKSLSKSASGGEMSRIMLGFKNLLASSLGLSSIIFDEIDSGVSGYVAFQVAKKMKEIAKATQVICITHIPQVAAISDNHLFISKHVEDERTKANIKELFGDEKVYEIAQMISGDKVTEASIMSAKELLDK